MLRLRVCLTVAPSEAASALIAAAVLVPFAALRAFSDACLLEWRVAGLISSAVNLSSLVLLSADIRCLLLLDLPTGTV